jgi:hypothetical protein
MEQQTAITEMLSFVEFDYKCDLRKRTKKEKNTQKRQKKPKMEKIIVAKKFQVPAALAQCLSSLLQASWSLCTMRDCA